MVAKRELKFIKSLHQKKYRSRHGLFLAEGVKLVGELLRSGWEPRQLFTTEPVDGIEGALHISEQDLNKVSALVQPNKVLGIFGIPRPVSPVFEGWLLALDGVRDPGNLGTIIRLCDWFGIRDLLCSPDTVDCYNPKVLMATMGSVARVRVHYMPLEQTLAGSGLPVFGASMEGEPLGSFRMPGEGILVMGSESHGISQGVAPLLQNTLGISPFGKEEAESLNVAAAAAIFLYEIRRRPAGLIQK
ncbi:MAG: RNA methyltransferase [Flavobacteriaceae bacterium]|nr:MAG: RNA methyltransferase [Flavobacteriaceae bacterium]